jgi:hypothetical protein
MQAVGRNGDRPRLLAVLDTAWRAQGEARPIESIELLEDQHGQRLAQIERRFSDRAEEIALVKLGHANTGGDEVGGGDHARGFESALQPRKVKTREDMRRIRRADEQCVRCT